MGSPRALTATGGDWEGSRELRKAAGVWPGPKRAPGEAQWAPGSGGGGGGSGKTSSTGKAAVGLKAGGGGGGGDGEDGPQGLSGSAPKGGRGARPKGLGVGDSGEGRLDELGLEAGVPCAEPEPRFCAAMNCLGRA